jgi:predicted transcriptional regulator
MRVGEICKRAVVSVDNTVDIVDAARLMREQHVGFLVVLKQGDTQRRPTGVITDRDIVLQVTAQDINPRLVTVEDAMTARPLIANEADDVGEVLQAMRFAGIRRVPVVDVRGSLIGIIAIDDAIDYVAGLLCDITGSIQNEQRQEWRARPIINTQRAL